MPKMVTLDRVGSNLPGCEQFFGALRTRSVDTWNSDGDTALPHKWKCWVSGKAQDEEVMVEIGRFSTRSSYNGYWDVLGSTKHLPVGKATHIFRHETAPVGTHQHNVMGGVFEAELPIAEANDVWGRVCYATVCGRVSSGNLPDIHTITGVSIHRGANRARVEIWVDGGYIASDPIEGETVEPSTESILSQINAILEENCMPLVKFAFRSHEDAATPFDEPEPRTAHAAQPSDVQPPADNASLFDNSTSQPSPASRTNINGASTGGAAPSSASPSPAAHTTAPERERPAPSTQTPTGRDAWGGRTAFGTLSHAEVAKANSAPESDAAQPPPTQQPKRTMTDKQREYEEEEAAARNFLRYMTELDINMKTLSKIAAELDRFTNQRKQLEEEDEDITASGRWADDTDIVSGAEEVEAYRKRHNELKCSFENIFAREQKADSLREEIIAACDRQYREANEQRDKCCDIYTARRLSQLKKEREDEEQKEEKQRKRRAANDVVSSLVAQSAKRAQQQVETAKLRVAEDMERGRDEVDNKAKKDSHVKFSLPGAEPEVEVQDVAPVEKKPRKRKEAPLSTHTNADPIIFSAVAPQPEEKPASQATAAPAAAAPPAPTQKKDKKGTGAKEHAPVDFNKLRLKEKLEAEQREYAKKNKAESKRVENFHKRQDRARMLFGQDELKAREVVAAEFLQHYDAFAEQMQADALVAVEDERVANKEREHKLAILRADQEVQGGVRTEELYRLKLVLLEKEERVALAEELRPIRRAVEDLIEEVREQERREAAAELKRKQKEELLRKEEERIKRQQDRIKRQQESLKQNNTMTSLVDKCKPTVFAAFADVSDSDEDKPKPKPKAKKPKKAAPAPKADKADKEDQEDAVDTAAPYVEEIPTPTPTPTPTTPAPEPTPTEAKKPKPSKKKVSQPDTEEKEKSVEVAPAVSKASGLETLPHEREELRKKAKGQKKGKKGGSKGKPQKKKKAAEGDDVHEEEEEEEEVEVTPLSEMKAAMLEKVSFVLQDNERMAYAYAAMAGVLLLAVVLVHVLGI